MRVSGAWAAHALDVRKLCAQARPKLRLWRRGRQLVEECRGKCLARGMARGVEGKAPRQVEAHEEPSLSL